MQRFEGSSPSSPTFGRLAQSGQSIPFTPGRSGVRIPRRLRNASLAHQVEQPTLNRRVRGSSPRGGTTCGYGSAVERHLAKVEVTGSIPVIRSLRGASSTGEHGFCKAAIRVRFPGIPHMMSGLLVIASIAQVGRASPRYGEGPEFNSRLRLQVAGSAPSVTSSSRSSSGQGHRPLTAATRVQIPVGTPGDLRRSPALASVAQWIRHLTTNQEYWGFDSLQAHASDDGPSFTTANTGAATSRVDTPHRSTEQRAG